MTPCWAAPPYDSTVCFDGFGRLMAKALLAPGQSDTKNGVIAGPVRQPQAKPVAQIVALHSGFAELARGR